MVAGWRLPEQRQEVDKIKMKLVAAFVLLRNSSARIISETTNNMRKEDLFDKIKMKLAAAFVLLRDFSAKIISENTKICSLFMG